MKRDIDANLAAWKNTKHRKPLILQGARQVGKTYALQKFAKESYESSVYLNFEEDKQLSSFFEKVLTPKKIIQDLEIHFQKKIHSQKTLIIFDELQECPNAQTSLKYFCEHAPEYHIVAAGSLLGVKTGGSFPVGKVDFLNLYPLSFTEFLQELHPQFATLIKSKSNFEPLSTAHHDALMSLLRSYFFVGGMPEAVNRYAQEKDFDAVRKIQHALLKSYERDFAKHAPATQVPKIFRIWQSIIVQLARENKKFKYSEMDSRARARDYEDAIQWLVDAGLILRCDLVNKVQLPLSHYTDGGFKIYLLDVGLLGAMADLSVKTLVEKNSILEEFRGAFTENYVAQCLVSMEKKLRYWSSEGKAEVDFIMESNQQIYPIEVKSGLNTKSKSLKIYLEKNRPAHMIRANALNFEKVGCYLNLPLYGFGKVLDLVSGLDNKK